MREHLTSIVRLLRENGDPAPSCWKTLSKERTSNSAPSLLLTTFGQGSGSVAACALSGGDRFEARREVERVLIRLGNEQIRAGNVNPRSAMWVEAFTEWKEMGL